MKGEENNNLADLASALQEAQNDSASGLEDGQVVNQDGEMVTLDRN